MNPTGSAQSGKASSPLSELTERRMSSTSALALNEDPRIRAYAKLEFPTFDMYIQKLSVIVGRRPAVVVAPAIIPMAVADAQLKAAQDEAAEVARQKTQVKLEEFVMGLVEDESGPPVSDPLAPAKSPTTDLNPVKLEVEPTPLTERLKSKLELDIPILSLTPSSQPGSPGALPSAVAQVVVDDPSLATLSLADPPITVAAAVAIAPTAPVAPVITTDIDLGPIRAVSRQHARLYFDYELGGWAIEVLGRNGVVVEGTWKAKGERESLGKR